MIRFHGDSIANQLAETSAATRDAVGEYADNVVARVSASGEHAAAAIRLHGDSIADRLAETWAATRSAVDAFSDDIVGRINSSSAQAVTAIRAQSESVADQLGLAGDSVARDFSDRSNSLVDRLQSGGERLSDTIVVHGDSLVVRLSDAADRLHDTVVVRGQVLEDRLNNSSERLSAVIRDRAEDAAAILDAAAARWGEQFDARETQLRGAVTNQNDALETLFDESTRRLVGAISAEGAHAQAQLEAAASKSLATLTSEVGAN